MAPWILFYIAGLLLALVIIDRLLHPRYTRRTVFTTQKLAGDTRLLYLLLWLAFLSILSYIAFALRFS